MFQTWIFLGQVFRVWAQNPYKQFREDAGKRKEAEKQQKPGDLQAEIARLKAKVQEQDKLFAGLQGENRILTENNKEISVKLEQAMVQAGSGKKQLKSSKNEPESKLTRWQYLKAVVKGFSFTWA